MPINAPIQNPSSIGKYQILGSLGRGGMGAVFHARHVVSGRLERQVALKVLFDSGAEEDLLREAQLATRVRNPTW